MLPVRGDSDGHLNILHQGVGKLNRSHLLAVVFGIGLATFLAIEPTQFWILLAMAGLIGLGTDGMIRSQHRAAFRRFDDTAIFLFVPVLLTIATGLFLEEVLVGYWNVPVALLAAIPFGMVLQAAGQSVDTNAPAYQPARLVLNIAAYLITFFLYAAIYDFGLGLWSATVMVALVSLVISLELLREEDGMETPRAFAYSGAICLLMGQAAWSLHFLPLQGILAGTFLLLIFYMLTGFTHLYLSRQLSPYTAAEFAAIGAVGLLIVMVSHAFI